MKTGKLKKIRLEVILSMLICCPALLFSSSLIKQDTRIKVNNLKCEYVVNPLGLDIQNPQFSWEVQSDKRGTVQTAFQIEVALSEEDLFSGNILWNSDKTNSSQAVGIRYNGPSLESRQQYFWRVKIWDQEENESDWSAPASFEMGLMDEEDWYSDWIAYAPGLPGRVLYFKGTYVLPENKKIKKARLYISGLGYYEMYINRKKVGDRVLDPAQSSYNKTIYYSTYDVKNYLAAVNTLVIPVAPGWYGMPKLRMQMEITFEDNSCDYVTTSYTRPVMGGPILYSSIFDGETYDARSEESELFEPFKPALLMNKIWAYSHVADPPGGKMVSQKMEAIRVVDTIIPEIINKEESSGIYILDTKQNLAGWASLRVQGKKGQKVTLSFAESLGNNGLINQDNLRNAKATDTYILKGEGIEKWEPSFTYHGFRYIQVEGYPGELEKGDVLVKRIRNDVPLIGKFHCSNDLLNRIHKMVVETEASNLHSVPTDCPQRDERMGWLNDMTVRIEQAINNFDLARFYTKYIRDVSDTQDKYGRITCVAPFRFGARPADPVSASYLLMAWKSYQYYGNRTIIADHYDSMKAWVNYLESRTDSTGIVDYSYYGDWSPPLQFAVTPESANSKDTPGLMMSTGYLYYCASMITGMAQLLEKPEDSIYYSNLAQKTAKAFNDVYWNKSTGGYASNNQAANSFALYLDIIPADRIPQVVNNLVEDVKKQDYHLTTGNLCTKYLIEMLTKHGYIDIAYKIVTQTTYPSWGYMLENGATTLWERWEYATGDAMNSHNHPMMGSVDSWFYMYVLGIIPDIKYPGFEKFAIHPYLPTDLEFAEGELNTVKGTVKCAWRKKDKNILLDIVIPANTTATVSIPVKKGKKITEGGKNISKIKSIKFLHEKKGYRVYEVGSGSYHFISVY
ncbi:alpha-L-rhamnosidase [Parabacteroides pacaensis]|uniref:alpha-L-rhamnosidase n=1 Tax=Parabacteroides pacaensis TaxID=2086575 RepID=UPI001F42B7FD|nr:alpha-L-rhamnosidase [Parabacteroides pacaensis]